MPDEGTAQGMVRDPGWSRRWGAAVTNSQRRRLDHRGARASEIRGSRSTWSFPVAGSCLWKCSPERPAVQLVHGHGQEQDGCGKTSEVGDARLRL